MLKYNFLRIIINISLKEMERKFLNIIKQSKIPLLVVFVTVLCIMPMFSLIDINSCDKGEWEEIIIYNPDFLDKQNSNHFSMNGWVAWESPEGNSQTVSFRYWFKRYEMTIDDVKAVGLKDVANSKFYISYIKFDLKQGGNSWSGGNKNWKALINCDTPASYISPNNPASTGEFTISTPGTSYRIYSHNWQEYYLTPFPTYITLKVQARVQMRNRGNVKATATSQITFTMQT